MKIVQSGCSAEESQEGEREVKSKSLNGVRMGGIRSRILALGHSTAIMLSHCGCYKMPVRNEPYVGVEISPIILTRTVSLDCRHYFLRLPPVLRFFRWVCN